MRTTFIRSASTLAALSGLALALGGCAASDDATSGGGAATPAAAATTHAVSAHWTYEGEEGPANWGELSDEYSLCATGEQQSPIDLSTGSDVEGDTLELDYGTVEEHVTDTGHTFQLVADADAEVEYNGVEYTLLQMHYHDPSEHTVDGEAAPVEFHFVHQDDEGNLLVIGVLGTEGAENAAYDTFVAGTEASEDTSGSADLPAMLPESLDHFAYSGSLTTPPCTEGVQWVVLQTPVELSSEQIAQLQEAYPHNARPVQPLNDREVKSAPTELD
jgi:carbonic anhydrase